MAVDYAALAKQYGGSSQPAPSQPPATGGTVDYASLAKQFGGTSQVTPPKAPQIGDISGGTMDRLKTAGRTIKDAFTSGVQQVKEGAAQAMKPGEAAGNLPFGALKIGAGVANAVFSPLAPLFSPLQ